MQEAKKGKKEEGRKDDRFFFLSFSLSYCSVLNAVILLLFCVSGNNQALWMSFPLFTLKKTFLHASYCGLHVITVLSFCWVGGPAIFTASTVFLLVKKIWKYWMYVYSTFIKSDDRITWASSQSSLAFYQCLFHHSPIVSPPPSFLPMGTKHNGAVWVGLGWVGGVRVHEKWRGDNRDSFSLLLCYVCCLLLAIQYRN